MHARTHSCPGVSGHTFWGVVGLSPHTDVHLYNFLCLTRRKGAVRVDVWGTWVPNNLLDLTSRRGAVQFCSFISTL
eukprot:3865102-Ditylum_brightwellii.AAC.2